MIPEHMKWMPPFSPEERAAFVKTHGEEWVRREERLLGFTSEIFAIIDPPKKVKK